MLEVYINGIKRLSKGFGPIADEYKIPVAVLWLSAFAAHIKYGVTPNEYLGYRFYEKNAIARKKYYTFRHAKKYEKILNDSALCDSFWDKAKFNTVFKDFVKRDWLLCEPGGGGLLFRLSSILMKGFW